MSHTPTYSKKEESTKRLGRGVQVNKDKVHLESRYGGYKIENTHVKKYCNLSWTSLGGGG
jgi:hypothetical protein